MVCEQKKKPSWVKVVLRVALKHREMITTAVRLRMKKTGTK